MIYDCATIISFIFRDMSFSTRNICVVLLAVVLGIYLLTPKAGAVEHCVGSVCLHCNGMILSVNESATMFGFDDQRCDVSFGHTPCSLNKHSDPNASALIVSPTNPYRQEAFVFFALISCEPSLFQNIGGNDKAGRFQITSDNIPIYLQNLSFLC